MKAASRTKRSVIFLSAGHQGRSPAQCSVVSPIPSTPTNIAPNHQPAQVVQGVPVISRDMVCSEKQVSSLAGCAHCRAHPPQPFKIYSESKPRQPEAIMHCPSCHKDLQPKIKKVSLRAIISRQLMHLWHIMTFTVGDLTNRVMGTHRALSVPT